VPLATPEGADTTVAVGRFPGAEVTGVRGPRDRFANLRTHAAVNAAARQAKSWIPAEQLSDSNILRCGNGWTCAVGPHCVSVIGVDKVETTVFREIDAVCWQ